MSTSTTPEKVLAEVNTIVEVMNTNTDFKMKDVSAATMKTDAAAASALLQQIASLELQLTPLRNNRDELIAKLTECCSRARAGIKGYFGPNSNQYEQVGGTRKSERKKPVRKTTAAAKAAGSN